MKFHDHHRSGHASLRSASVGPSSKTLPCAQGDKLLPILFGEIHYSYLGTQGLIQMSGMDRRFFGRLGATRLERAVCGEAGSSGVAATIGSDDPMRPEDVIHRRFIILWGTNTVVTNLHLWPFIRQAKENGATVVVIDPLKTRTAAAADWHVRPLPGTDAALALGMMHIIVAEGLHHTDYVTRHTLGFDQLLERSLTIRLSVLPR